MFEDGPRSYVLYGPLALVQHGGGNDVMLGKPLQPFDWVLSRGTSYTSVLLTRICPALSNCTEKDEVLRDDCDLFELPFELEKKCVSTIMAIRPRWSRRVQVDKRSKGSDEGGLQAWL